MASTRPCGRSLLLVHPRSISDGVIERSVQLTIVWRVLMDHLKTASSGFILVPRLA